MYFIITHMNMLIVYSSYFDLLYISGVGSWW